MYMNTVCWSILSFVLFHFESLYLLWVVWGGQCSPVNASAWLLWYQFSSVFYEIHYIVISLLCKYLYHITLCNVSIVYTVQCEYCIHCAMWVLYTLCNVSIVYTVQCEYCIHCAMWVLYTLLTLIVEQHEAFHLNHIFCTCHMSYYNIHLFTRLHESSHLSHCMIPLYTCCQDYMNPLTCPMHLLHSSLCLLLQVNSNHHIHKTTFYHK